MQEGRDRARPQDPRRPRGERPGRVLGRRRAGQGRARGLTAGTRDDAPVAAHFRRRADDFERGGSALYARLAREIADDPLVAEIVGARGSSWDAPLAFFGGVHLLALTGEEPEPWGRLREVLEARGGWLARFVAEEPVQTNEVQRAWGLLPGFLSAGAPVLDLVELGPSAGLNLLWDRWSYRYGPLTWGANDAPLTLAGTAVGGPPAELLERRPIVRRRLGIDRAPVDIRDDAAALRLQAFVWADQEERLTRLRAALEVGRRDPPELVTGDYVEELPELLATRAPPALTVVFHSASTAYLSAERRARLRAVIEAAGEEGPLAWLSYEHAGDDVEGEIGFETFALDLRVWPGGSPQRLARLDGHGNRLRWVGS